MATNTGPSTASSDGSGSGSGPQTIVLHVLSPAVEVPKKLIFSAIPTSTTVGELKLKIRDAVATKPAPERQRLIYRGKALTYDSTMLKDVFGQDTVSKIAVNSNLPDAQNMP